MACSYFLSGQEQAELTGQRLRDLDLNYTRIVSSTMARAVETADIIHKYLPELTLVHDDLLCEGRPIVPEPVLHWRPDHFVSYVTVMYRGFFFFSWCFFFSPSDIL